MIIACPSCGTRYQVDEAKFPPNGRMVRCAKCSNSWHEAGPRAELVIESAPQPAVIPAAAAAAPQAAAEPAAPEPQPEPEAEPQPSAARAAYKPEPKAAAEPRARAMSELRGHFLPALGVIAGWLALIAAVLVIAFAAVRYRQDIAVIWPQSAGVYSSLGMKVSASPVDFRNVDYHREVEDGMVVLAVTGRIVNNGRRELPVPPRIRVTLSDASNHELYHWTFGSGAATLKPGQSLPFVTRLSSPPAASRHLEVRFAKDGS